MWILWEVIAVIVNLDIVETTAKKVATFDPQGYGGGFRCQPSLRFSFNSLKMTF